MSDDTSEIVERVTRGWAEGSPDVLLGIACGEIESLRKQREKALSLYLQRNYGVERLRAELAAMQKHRDQAIKLLSAMVQYIGDDMPSGPPVPEHYCDAIHRPDIGVCRFCDSWQDANILLYGDEWGSKYGADLEAQPPADRDRELREQLSAMRKEGGAA